MMSLFELRQHYGQGQLLEKDLPEDPMHLFDSWFILALYSEVLEPNAMVLSTIGLNGNPRSRIVLLKEYNANGFTFFTNYNSDKGREIESNPNIALNFPWINMEKQVRIEGIASKLPESVSEDYFNSRPIGSRLGAVVSDQSKPITNREELENKLAEISHLETVSRPENWGGYIVKPTLIEFWQGRPNRLHDRIEYSLENNLWSYKRLQP